MLHAARRRLSVQSQCLFQALLTSKRHWQTDQPAPPNRRRLASRNARISSVGTDPKRQEMRWRTTFCERK